VGLKVIREVREGREKERLRGCDESELETELRPQDWGDARFLKGRMGSPAVEW
jgi:hypothetical protein